ncbi:transcription antitermination protein NusB [Mycoplasma marinum]|uniref:Transcription antitermination protein NusB n=1 Tax=Mycoplasma marinum TaxID=1937190 RepID=A0A4R0XJC8_9MOLU|nr:transcription antitermination protein NusB [Mycoplasma marinum]TCG10736.1 transcription antitermination protein NusB [Mycoplasma marinum]
MSQTKSRMNVINVIYIAELTGEELTKFNIREDYDLSENELKALDWIIEKNLLLKKLITKFTKDSWKWERIAPLERAMLIFGAFELSFRDKKIVINEIVILAKKYIYEESYKFINAILDKVADYYESKKQN